MSDQTSMATPVMRLVATAAAIDAVDRLVAKRGPVMFFQSGGCCDGSLPICFDLGEFIISEHDIMLGTVRGSPFYIDARQFEVWRHTQLVLDVGDGFPEGFSLSAGDDSHFITRSRVLSRSELAALDGDPAVSRP